MRADAEIVITFSEPMHRVETEKAYGSLDLPTKDVTFLWSNGDRTLTIHPDDGLEYGVPPAGPGAGAPRTYAYLIASEARDAAGNRLEEDFTASFTTLREYWRVLPVDQATLITRSKQGTDGYMAACGEEETSAVIGEFAWPGKVPVLQGRGLLVNFELLGRDQPDVPDDVLSATLSFENVLENISLGPLLVERVRESASLVTWDTPVLETLTSTKTGDIRTADVRPGVLDQFERGVNLIQFFIHYELMLIDDDIVQSSVVTCGKSHIEVKFLGR